MQGYHQGSLDTCDDYLFDVAGVGLIAQNQRLPNLLGNMYYNGYPPAFSMSLHPRSLDRMTRTLTVKVIKRSKRPYSLTERPLQEKRIQLRGTGTE